MERGDGTAQQIRVDQNLIFTRVSDVTAGGDGPVRFVRSDEGMAESIAGAVRDLCGVEKGARLPTGTSVTINQAELQPNGAPSQSALLVTQGHRDILRLTTVANAPSGLSPQKSVEIAERCDATGTCLRPLNPERAKQELMALYRQGVRGLSVSFLHSVANPDHECQIAKIATDVGFKSIVLAHQIAPDGDFRARSHAAVAGLEALRAKQQLAATLGEHLRQYVDVDAQNLAKSPAQTLLDSVTLDHGSFAIGARHAPLTAPDPVCFGNGGALSVFDCAVLLDDFEGTGLERVENLTQALQLDTAAVDIRLCELLSQRSSQLGIPHGDPIALSRCILDRAFASSARPLAPRTAPGIEEWLVERAHAVLSDMTAGTDFPAGLGWVPPEGTTVRWIAWAETPRAPTGPDVTAHRVGASENVTLFAHDSVSRERLDAALSELTSIETRLGGADHLQTALLRVFARSNAQLDTALSGIKSKRQTIVFDDGAQLAVQIGVPQGEKALTIDFDGTSARQGIMATSQAHVHAAVLHALRSLTPSGPRLLPDCLNRCDIVIQHNSVLNADAISPSHSQIIVQAVISGLMSCLANAASGEGRATYCSFSGTLDGRTFQYDDTLGGGGGASRSQEGASGSLGPLVWPMTMDVETLENAYPLRIEENYIRTRSGGQGDQMGGDGLLRSIRALCTASFRIVSSNNLIPPFGANGGSQGACSEVMVVRDQGRIELLESGDETQLAMCDLVILKTPGGGGFG